MSLYLHDEGEGAALLLLHGLGASARAFPLGGFPGARVIAPDLPGCGRSGRWAAFEPRELAEGLLGALRERGVERFEVIGHSFGGLVALELAALAPKAVAGLTLASVPVLGVPLELQLFLSSPFALFAAPWIAGAARSRPALAAYLRGLWGTRASLEERHVDVYEETARNADFAGAVLEGLRAVARYQFEGEALRAAGLRVRVVWGEADRLVPVAVGRHLALQLGTRLEVLPGVGHCVPEEHPDALAAIAD